MWIINLIKVGLIWIADTINWLFDPFEKVSFQTTRDLGYLEEQYSYHLDTNFQENGRFLYQKPMPADAGDEALFQGLYLGVCSLKGADISEPLAALQRLFINGTLIRGYYENGTPNDTTSNDSATGVLFGLYAYWRYVGFDADDLIVKWTTKVCDSDYTLTDLYGKPTPYGKLEQGILTDPLRITLLLALLALAAKVNKYTFGPKYERLYHKYREILAYPKVGLLWWDKDYDTHRAAIHLHILWVLTKDLIYYTGLKRLHRITKKSNNAWVQVLCSPVIDKKDMDLSILNTMDYEHRIQGNLESLNQVESVKWGNKLRAKQTLPFDHRGSQEFFWQRNMFSLNEWEGVKMANVYHCGLDFLLVYWMAKREGLL